MLDRLRGRAQQPDRNPVGLAMRSTTPAWVHVAIFSAVVNILMLTASIYMLQIYDRVLMSRSVPTLVLLSLIAVAAYLLQGVLDGLRQKILARIGATVDEKLSPLTTRATIVLPLKGAKPAEALQPMRDLDTIRQFLSGLGPTAMIDMPFLPIFLAASFLLHPLVGWFVVGGAVLIVSLTLLTERRTAGPTRALSRSGAERSAIAESGRRNAEAIMALGMQKAYTRIFNEANKSHVKDNLSVSDAASGVGSLAKVTRLLLQSAVLGLGAWLVIRGEMSAGGLIAGTILTSRALAPVELAVAHWKGFVASRQAYGRLRHVLPMVEEPAREFDLPAPRRSLKLTDVTVVPPGTQRIVVHGVSFEIQAGQVLGLIGSSASGKSSLARALVGVWPTARGAVRLDGALLEHWDPDVLGQHVGYLPQDVELFDGTVASNIARFDSDANSEKVLAAARTAGAHDMILSFPHGYETHIGEGGIAVSGGQRQRLALARAMYGNPFLVVLDEPNSSLDAEGDEALRKAMLSTRERGGICIVITHRPAGLAAVDKIAVLSHGQLQAFGPRDEVLAQIAGKQGQVATLRPHVVTTPPAAKTV